MTMHHQLERYRITSIRLAKARQERKAMPKWERMGREMRDIGEWITPWGTKLLRAQVPQ